DHAHRRVAPRPGDRWGARARDLAGHLYCRASRPAAPAGNRAAIHRQQVVIPGVWRSHERRSKPTDGRPCTRSPSRAMLSALATCGPRTKVAREMKRVEESVRLIIADDHPLFRGALREAVSGLFDEVEIAEAGSFEDVAKLLERAGEVDLILLDLTMPGVRGFPGLMYLRAQSPSVPIVVVSANDDPGVIRRCMDFGALGFIPKTLGIEAMRGAISRVFEGGVWTPPD